MRRLVVVSVFLALAPLVVLAQTTIIVPDPGTVSNSTGNSDLDNPQVSDGGLTVIEQAGGNPNTVRAQFTSGQACLSGYQVSWGDNTQPAVQTYVPPSTGTGCPLVAVNNDIHHTYAGGGTFTITLTNSGDDTSVDSVQVTIAGAPAPAPGTTSAASGASSSSSLGSVPSALTSQIQALLAQIQALSQNGTNAISQTTASGQTTASAQGSGPACPILTRALSRGASGADVLSLQQYLITTTYLDASAATGFFGPLTEVAVQHLQASLGIVSSGSPADTGFGLVGNRTRAAISQHCLASGGTTLQSSLSCPFSPQPNTPCAGTWSPLTNGNGCTLAWQCSVPLPSPTSPQACTAVTLACPTGTHVVAGAGCAQSCVANTNSGSCPAVQTPQCTTGSLQPTGYDGNGCALAYQCVGGNSSGISFSASPQSGQVPLSVSFTITGIQSQGGYLVSFGDGSTGGVNVLTPGSCVAGGSCTNTIFGVTHTYATAGTYTATLSGNNTSYGSTVVTVNGTVSGSAVTIDQSSLTTSSGQPTITGTVSGQSGLWVLIGTVGGGENDTALMSTSLGNVIISGNTWRATVNQATISPGTYIVHVKSVNAYGGSGDLLASGTLTVSQNATCQNCSIPFISSITPSSGPVGSSVTLSGSGFIQGGTTFLGSLIWGTPSYTVGSGGTTLTFTVPSTYTHPGPEYLCPAGSPTSCPQSYQPQTDPVSPGTYVLSLSTNGNAGQSSSVNFTVTSGTSQCQLNYIAVDCAPGYHYTGTTYTTDGNGCQVSHIGQCLFGQ